MKFPFLCLIMPAAMLSFAGEPAAVSLQDRPGCIEISIDAGRDCQAGDIALYIDNDDWRPSGWRGPDNDWQCGADLQIRNGVARWWWGETLESGDWGNGMELPVRFDGRILTITVPDDRYLLKRETTVRAVAMIGAESVPADPGRETLSWEIEPPPFPEIKAPVPVPPPGRPEPPGEPLTRREFRGFYADEPEGRDGLRNPERGLRTMTYCGELPAPGRPRPRPAELGWLTRYPQTTLLQAYCWLTDYYDRPLPESKLAALRRDLAGFRAAGVKLLLRFAYERSHLEHGAGPDQAHILQHMRQLREVVANYADVIYVLQAGFIGAYGEWHTSAQGLDQDNAAKRRIFTAFGSELLPENRMTQLRVPSYKRTVFGQPAWADYRFVTAATGFDGSLRSRTGFANDGFGADPTEGGTWTEPPYFGNPGNPEFDMKTRESAFVAVDGELFCDNFGGMVPALWALERLRLHHYTSLGYIHSNAEAGSSGQEWTFDRWRRTPLSPDSLLRRQLPISDRYFRNSDGSPAERTVLEYLRDHLGYRLELQSAAYRSRLAAGGTLELDLDVINRGFAVPINPRTLYVTLQQDNGEFYALPTPVDIRRWQPFAPDDPAFTPLRHRAAIRIPVPDDLPPGEYGLGLRLPDESQNLCDDGNFMLRFANGDLEYDPATGIHTFGRLTVTPK